MSFDEILRDILTRSSKLTPHAASNLERDLAAIVKRIDAGEYMRADFLDRNAFDVPRRTREFMLYMEGWLEHASRWVDALDGVKASRVADLCPGWAPKVELALARLDFRGEIVVVDADRDALAALVPFVRAFAPPFKLRALTADVLAKPRRRFPLVTVNHAIDDLILAKFAERGVYASEATLVAAWEKIARSGVGDVAVELADAFARWVDDDGTLIVSHYPSYIDGLLGAPAASLVEGTFRDVIMRLTRQRWTIERERPKGYVTLTRRRAARSAAPRSARPRAGKPRAPGRKRPGT